ncbi:DUF943 family protein [Cronobacter turicensis]
MRSQVRRVLISITAVGVALAGVWQLWDALAPTTIIRADSHAVYIEHLPLTTRAKIAWWNKNKDVLQEKYHLIDDPENVSVTVMYFGGYVAAPTGSNDGSIDDYNCFDDIKNDKKCIYNDVVMRVGGDYNNKLFFWC